MARISRKDTDRYVDLINSHRDVGPGSPGSVQVGSAYGGYRVELVINEYGGIDALQSGYGPLRESLEFLRGMYAGLDLPRKMARHA